MLAIVMTGLAIFVRTRQGGVGVGEGVIAVVLWGLAYRAFFPL